MKPRILFLAVAATALPTLVLAQTHHHGNHSMPMPSTQAAETPATKAFREANAKMHRDMDIEFTGNADVDFVRGMIPHHQGAIDMAKIALQHAKDEEVRKLATAIIREQEREIAEMQNWLKAKGAAQ